MALKKKRKTPRATRAPGKSDPRFLSRLSRAIEDKYRSEDPRGSDDTEKNPPQNEKKAKPAVAATKKTKASSTPRGRSPTTPKKGSASSVPSKRTADKNRASLLKELRALITELDEEGLAFLLEQAHVHRYNMEVERLNEAEERISSSKTARKRSSSASAAGNEARVSTFRIERSKDGNTYHIISNGRYKMFSAEEMLALVRIAHANSEGIEAGKGLYRWMSRERIDALADLGISGPTSPDLSALARLLRSSFAKPERKG